VVGVYLKDRLLISWETSNGMYPQPNKLCHLHGYSFLNTNSVYKIGIHISPSQDCYPNSVNMDGGVGSSVKLHIVWIFISHEARAGFMRAIWKVISIHIRQLIHEQGTACACKVVSQDSLPCKSSHNWSPSVCSCLSLFTTFFMLKKLVPWKWMIN
jgi:hypothetical protein